MAGLAEDSLMLYPSIYNETNHTDINTLANARVQNGADIMSPIITRAYGKESDWFPLVLLTEGKGRMKPVESLDGKYKVPIMGKPKQSSVITGCEYTAADTNIGAGKASLFITFRDNWFSRDQDIQNGGRIMNKFTLKLLTDGVKTGNGWRYEARLVGANPNAVIPFYELAVGKKWSRHAAVVGLLASRGNAHKTQAPAQFQNQTNLLRKSIQYKGNVQNKVMNIQIKMGDTPTTYWVDYEKYMCDLEFKREQENVLWWETYNADANGVIHDRDINSGEIAPRGAGVVQQMVNKTTHSGRLTASKLRDVIQAIFYNVSPGTKKDIVLFTGVGGRRLFQQAMAEESANIPVTTSNSYFIRDPENNVTKLEYGAYFGSYVTEDGHRITIKLMDSLDRGGKAEACDKYKGLPVCSYDMYFLDMSTVEGEPNIQFVYEKGREETENVELGVGNSAPRGLGINTKVVSTDKDASAIHYMRSLGVYIKNPTTCLAMTCELV